MTNEEAWKKAFQGLLAKGILKKWDGLIKVNNAFKTFFFSLEKNECQTFVRYDFGDDEWFVRESTLIPTEGSLY